MLTHSGPAIAPPDMPPAAWATAAAARGGMVLAPGSARGWFGGRALVGLDPLGVRETSLAEAGDLLDAALTSDTPLLVAALASYDSPHVVATYDHGLVLAEDGWRPWGDWGAAPMPTPLALKPPRPPLAADLVADFDQTSFSATLRDVQEAIRRGDVYVLNLTHRISGTPLVTAAHAFTALSALTPSMGAFWQLPHGALASASPERFLRVHRGIATIEPIKGTRPRGTTAAEDARLAEDLRTSEKERAEHVMIVDLERNDLGRVSLPGSVEVDPLFEVVATPYVHQLVSTVRSTLRPGTRMHDLLAATFPCGSVTGAPKIAAMDAIRRLELSPRGAYTGSLLVAIPGELDSSVLIRTLEYEDGSGARPACVRYGAGCGITIDSDPADEWTESVLKAAPLLGDGAPAEALCETCRVSRGQVPLLRYHLARLASGGCGRSILERVRSAVEAQAAGHDRGRLRVTVSPTGEVAIAFDRTASSLEVPGGPLLHPVVVAAPALPPGAAKPADRSSWDAAQRVALSAGADQALLVSSAGVVLDGATASVWLVRGRELVTPPAPPALAGVARAYLLDHARVLGLTARIAEFTLADLDAADEIFLTNAYGGAVAVRDRGGTVGQAVLRLMEAALRGEERAV